MQTIKNTIAENFGGSVHGLAKEEHQFDIDKDVPRLDGKVAVITGGTEGIGYATGFVMLRNGLEKLILLSNSEDVYQGAVKDITEKLGKEYADRVSWIQQDISDLPGVAQAAKKIESSTDRLDILVMNAARGIMTYELTDWGLDRHMGANHFGHVVLLANLFPLLKKTASSRSSSDPVRVQVQASNAHQGAPSDTKFASIDEMNTDLGPNGQYGRSKLAAILWARWLAKQYPAQSSNILFNATHPGFVETKMSIVDIHEPYPILGYGMSTVMSPFKKDQWMGAASTLYASTKTMNTGEYVCPPAIPEPGSSQAQDAALGDQLMKFTNEVIDQKFPGQNLYPTNN